VKIVATCPHCFNTLRDEYPQLGGSYQVVHHVEMLAELVREGKLKPTQEIEQIVAYHDPCYLGRYHDLYDEPRAVIDAVPGVQRREIGCNRDRAMCCGAGGARAFMEETRGKRINHLRVEQAMEVEPQRVATACPYCLMMLEDGARAKGVYDSMPIEDVAELLERSLGAQASNGHSAGPADAITG
jgi:Fe-S oxidoreductase